MIAGTSGAIERHDREPNAHLVTEPYLPTSYFLLSVKKNLEGFSDPCSQVYS